MIRPTILDLDLVVVPREATDEMSLRGADEFFSPEPESTTQENVRAASVFRRALSASPYPTAWDDVRKYVEGLETEVERLKNELGDPDGVIAHADSITKLSEARIAELEKRLADAERVIEPFAALPDAPHGKRSYFLELLVRPEGDDPADGVKHYGPAIRAARAYMEKAAGNPPVGNKDIGERHGDHH